jgi:glycosyltransferase involved in cell wall biosynthesis
MSGKPLVSIVIPAWNEEKYITATLESVFVAGMYLERAGGSYEVIVVDNDSSDATAARAAEFPVRIVREERHCIAAVRNRGARAARGEYLVFLDADSRASENSLTRICETLSGGCYVGGGVKIYPDKWSLRTFPFYAMGPVMMIVLGVTAGMIFSTREAHTAVKGFDEALYAAEDLDFVTNIKAFGRKTGKKFAHLTDVHIKTSVRKFRTARLRDWLIFPRYFLNRNIVRNADNCRFWYAEGHR